MNQPLAARVRVAYGAHGVAEGPDGEFYDCLFRRKVGRPCCGDQVDISSTDGQSWVVEQLHPRRNEFVRADQRGRRHVVAANLDRVLVVIAPAPLPSRDLLDRYLIAVHSLGIEPVVVLNKSDLPVAGHDPGSETLRRLDHYAALGYTVVYTDATRADGIEQLRPVVASGTSILVGQSGVGKSSLARRLLPDLDIQTGALSRVTGKGTHTTTTTILYRLPAGGSLIDSPGVWEYGLWKLDDRDIASGFREFAGVSGRCKFNNCTHHHEPGCAIKAAVAAGAIAPWRHAAYTRLLEQNQQASPAPL
jgi:ribosome biogenesis GTPase